MVVAALEELEDDEEEVADDFVEVEADFEDELLLELDEQAEARRPTKSSPATTPPIFLQLVGVRTVPC